MGYYTYMYAEVKTSPDGDYLENDSHLYAAIEKWFANCLEDEDALTNLIRGEDLKWYDVDKDMAEFAKEFPNVYFILWGEGEDRGDVWVIETYDGEFHKDCADYTPPQTYFG
jgi:hypothetical protein